MKIKDMKTLSGEYFLFVWFQSNMTSRNLNTGRSQIGPGVGIPALRIQADTPQPNNDNLRLPVLNSAQRSVISNGKSTQNGYVDKALFATPRAPGPGPNGIFNGQRTNRNGMVMYKSMFFVYFLHMC